MNKGIETNLLQKCYMQKRYNIRGKEDLMNKGIETNLKKAPQNLNYDHHVGKKT